MNRLDYINKLQGMIDDGINNGIYKQAEDTTLHDLKIFKDFLYRNFNKYEHYKDMIPTANQPAQLYGLAKTHKFNNINNIDVRNLKFRPIIAQVGTCTYKAAQIIAKYLQPLLSENEYMINNTQKFPTMLKNQPPLQHDEEYVSYDVESLFTNVPVRETIDYILDEIYVHGKLPKLSSRLIFKRLLMKLSTESLFLFNDKFYQQIDGCTMGGPLSVVFANIFMTKMEKDIVEPSKPEFYRRFVDDSINKRKKNAPDELFEKFNNYHNKIKFTIEISPNKFLDTQIQYTNTTIETSVHRGQNKVPVHWSSKVPKKYKRNTINADLYRAQRISSNFDSEKVIIADKFHSAGFPKRFVSSVIRQFNENQNDEMIIPKNLFKEPKPYVRIELPYCPKNEGISKSFMSKFHEFTKNKYMIIIKWNTKKVKSLFKLKSKNPHPSCKIYVGECSCGETYIGETARNVEVRWSEHNSLKGNSEPAKHLESNDNSHVFNWKVLISAPLKSKERKNLEAFQIALKKPSLNNQLETKQLNLFRNGIT
ncbi:uncharacterized protein [Clytia hemisphaerica]|uniref:uncharacterized protein n=1 Tax=Clytia hemisphaerica TaxID=252671 RepID=UPI0034D7126F